MQYVNGYIFDASYPRMYSPRMSENKTKGIGDRLDEAMKDKFTQSSLARASGVPQATISRILKGGGKKGPETETVKKLAVACEVTFEWLVGMDGTALVRSVRVEPANDTVVPAHEALELLTAYLASDPKDRASVLNLAKVSAKRATRRKGRVTGNQS